MFQDLSTLQRTFARLTDQSFLAEVLGLLEIVLPLEQGKSLVDQGQDVNTHRLALLLHLHGLVELLNCLREVLLVEEKFTVVVVDIGHFFKVLHGSSEGGHGGRNGAHLVLRNTKLNVGVDESTVEVDGFLVILSSLGELSEDEVKLGAVVVDVGVILVVGDGELEVVGSGVLVSFSTCQQSIYQT